MAKISVETSVLEQILANQETAKEDRRKLAKDFAQLSMDFSVYKNEQEKYNHRISSYLENDEATGQPGLVKQVSLLTETMKKFEAKLSTFDKKITVFATGITITIGLIKFLLGKLSFLKLFT